jgi:hypothetical protein
LRERPYWLSRAGYGIAYATILSPFAFLLALFPLFPIKVRPGRRRPLTMCQMCEWTFGAFALAVTLIVVGIVYVVVATRDVHSA